MSNVNIEPGLRYSDILVKVHALAEGRSTDVGLLANVSALLYWSVENINWVGFYLRSGDELFLGPFHGKPACISIPIGAGVCGLAAARCETVVVDDVEAFEGHIACDSASRSEIVVPMLKHGAVCGVLDVDSHVEARFGADDRRFFESVVRVLMQALPECRTMLDIRA